jgi:hypothetical protein
MVRPMPNGAISRAAVSQKPSIPHFEALGIIHAKAELYARRQEQLAGRATTYRFER